MPPAPRFSPQEQEQIVLTAAARCIEESSLLDFTMSAISKAAGLSMGSIYKHIQTKEDVLVALATQTYKYQKEVFARVLSLPLTMPERAVGVALLPPDKIHKYPFGQYLEMLMGNEAVLKRASSGWLQQMTQVDQETEALFQNAMLQACHDGELAVTEDQYEACAEELMVGLWSMNVGFFQVAFQRHARRPDDTSQSLPFPASPDSTFIRNYVRLINSYPWRTPLTMESVIEVEKQLVEMGLR